VNWTDVIRKKTIAKTSIYIDSDRLHEYAQRQNNIPQFATSQVWLLWSF